MTYKIIRESMNSSGKVVIFDVLDDSGNIVVGGLVENFDTDVTDSDIAARLEMRTSDIAASRIPGDATGLELANKRLQLKDHIVSAMMANPSVALADVQVGMSWDDAKLVEAMVRMYAVGLRDRGLLQDFIDTPDGCFDALRDFVHTVSAEQLEIMLRDEEMR